MSSTATPPVPDRIGRYKIERKIGEGGMGVVYAARDERLDRTVALKTIRGETDDTSRKRLWREARAAAGISHPNICQLYEVEETADGLVMAMELLAGEPLGARVARGPLSPADTSTIALQVLDALDALHARGLIHRDLKPSNLFLTPHGVKLLDFGLARPIASSLGADSATRLTEAGAIVGTPNYMAPEQVRGEALDARADLFALAAMLFEMLSGKVAFDGATMIDVLHAVLHEQPPALSGGATVAGLDRVIHKALQKQAADRYDSATAMAAAIREVIADRDSAELSAPCRPHDDTIHRPAVPRAAPGRRNRLPGLQPARRRHDVADRHAQPARALQRRRGPLRPAGARPAQARRRRRRGRGADGDDSSRRQPASRDGAAGRSTRRYCRVVALVAASVGRRVRDAGRAGGGDRPLAVAVAGRAREPRGPARRAAQPGRLRAVSARQRAGARLGSPRRGARRLPEVRDARFAVRAGLGGTRPLPAGAGEVLRRHRSVPRGRALVSSAPSRSIPTCRSCTSTTPNSSATPGERWTRCAACCSGRRRAVDPEHFAGLVHACRYAGLLNASVAAHEEARRLDPGIPTSVVNAYLMLGDYERILRIDEGGDPDSKVMALYRLGRREEALAAWQRAPADAPATYKAWDEMMVACLTDGPGAREAAERAVGRNELERPGRVYDRRDHAVQTGQLRSGAARPTQGG